MKVETRTFIRILLVLNNLIMIAVTGFSLDFLFSIDPSSMSELQYGAASAAVTGLVTGYVAIFRYMYSEYMENIVKLSGMADNKEFKMEGTLKVED